MLYEADFALTCLLTFFYRAGEQAGATEAVAQEDKVAPCLEGRLGRALLQGGMGSPLIISAALNESPVRVGRSVKEVDVSSSGRS